MSHIRLVSTETLRTMSLAANDGDQVPAATPAVEPSIEPSNLPSDVNKPKGWDAVKEAGLLPEDLINDPEALAAKFNGYKKFMDEHNATKSQETDKAKTEAAAAEAATAQADGLRSMLPEFMANGMELTPEIESKAAELGVDTRDLKLGAIDLKAKMTTAYDITGGKENYDTMISEMGSKMTPSQQKAFNVDVMTDLGEYAVRGLHSAWLDSTNGTTPRKRIEGSPATSTGVKPYATSSEMLADVAYLKRQGKNDVAARQKHKARLAATPDNIVYGR